MFEKYNEKARRALFFARYEASKLGSKVIVAGSFDRVEIWDQARYDRQTDEGGARIKGAAV